MDDETLTDRLRLRRPTDADFEAIHEIHADPRVWLHYPTLRHADRAPTERMFARWAAAWDEMGLGSWVVRLRDTGEVIGAGGCTMLPGEPGERVWNLGYRISADHHGHGYATELARAALAAARSVSPDTPVIAYLVEHNRASAAVAEKVGLRLVHRAPDAGNPDPEVIRLVYADRELADAQLATALR
ncbi:GNAT family N-acetyltransferase [Microbacterium esteraromaticum]|uniref:GNAT family N-acetyltransferase n=1 Tax=Microbacterium esteraromaticum TaxID=57043 RepID=A0A7D8AJI0_9MICO|nr:GNAT family N-acetyltransferase [Microbacterium esteraromaticum]QMU97009.1 GNAT family N-acetyltransferase [Microbacterium esteraromaticum]